MNSDKYRVKIKDLAKKCNPDIFKFATTAEVKPLKGIIGQDRAVRALAFGLDMNNDGYNIYLSGFFGTGKTTLAREMLDKKARSREVPDDWCYVNNFKSIESPKALRLPAGVGKVFKQDIAENMDKVLKQIVKALESEDFDTKKNAILTVFVEETNQMYMRLEEESRTHGFSITKTQNGISSVPLKDDGEPLSQEEYVSLSEEEKNSMMKRSKMVQERINESFRQYKELEKSIKEKIKALELETAKSVSGPHFSSLIAKYGDYPDALAYLQDMQEDVLRNLDMFTANEEPSPLAFLRQMDKKALTRRYQVNQIVDNSGLKYAPVIFETNPTYANLFGHIEFESEFGILATDFSKIKPGSIHRANGGYLVLHVYDIIRNFYVWDKLKRVIKNKEIIVESINKNLGFGSSENLQPEPIPVNIKVILIGEPFYYYLLYTHDEEFQKLFKIKADFDVEMERSLKHTRDYARLISSVCESEKLRHFNPEAVARVVDYGSRMADDQQKLTTLFNKLVEVIYEANCLAEYDHAEIVEGKHVKKAIEEKKYRSSMVEEKIQEYIENNTLLINVTGSKVGELNGLAVYEMGDYSFGKPVRITAKTFMGEKGLVNIEREIRLSGSIHSKGVLTLNGYLGAQYAQDHPLSLSASLTIEQSYSGIEGDSASSAELYALLSSLSGVELQQGIAVTGSVNQNGEIQPVGGVNQKIEGFYKVCQTRGLTGRQGVIIPKQNVSQLMLDEEIILAVKNKKFHIWAVEHIDQGIEILSNIPAGRADENGRFPPGSVHYLAARKLSQWSSKRQEIPGGEKNKLSREKKIRRRRR